MKIACIGCWTLLLTKTVVECEKTTRDGRGAETHCPFLQSLLVFTQSGLLATQKCNPHSQRMDATKLLLCKSKFCSISLPSAETEKHDDYTMNFERIHGILNWACPILILILIFDKNQSNIRPPCGLIFAQKMCKYTSLLRSNIKRRRHLFIWD